MKKGLIGHNGQLAIWRARTQQFEETHCKFNLGGWACKDNCPLFGEPEMSDGKIYLNLCQSSLEFEKFYYESEHGDKQELKID